MDNQHSLIEDGLPSYLDEEEKEDQADLKSSLMVIENLVKEEQFVLVVGGLNQVPQQIFQQSNSLTPTDQIELDFSKIIDENYFKDGDATSRKNRKQVHKLPKFLKDPQVELTIEVSLIKVVFCSGADFDFKKSQDGKVQERNADFCNRAATLKERQSTTVSRGSASQIVSENLD